MIKVGIIGATGYAGGELVRLLMNHKEAEIVWYGSRSYIDKKYSSVYQNMFQLVEDTCLDDYMEQLALAGVLADLSAYDKSIYLEDTVVSNNYLVQCRVGGAIILNTEVLKAKGLAEPKS